MRQYTFAFAILATMAPGFAQGGIGTAVTRSAGFVRAEHFQVAPLSLNTVPANTNLAPAFSMSARSGNAGASAGGTVTQGRVVVFSFSVSAAADTRGTAGGADVATQLDALLGVTVTQPTRGVLTVQTYTPPSQGAPGCGSWAVDIGDDGIVDVLGRCTDPGYGGHREFELALSPGELRIHVAHSGQLNVWPNFLGEYSAQLRVSWIPWTVAATTYHPSCVPTGFDLVAEHGADGGFLLRGPATRSNMWLLFGTVQQALPLQLPPQCVLATDIMTFLPWSDPTAFPWTPLPSGFALNVQAVWFGSPAATWTTNALRIAMP